LWSEREEGCEKSMTTKRKRKGASLCTKMRLIYS
jgi:hypothetical protein